MSAALQCYSLLVLGVLALHVSNVSGGLEHTCPLSARNRGPHSRGFCGSNLVQLLEVLCSKTGHAGRGWYNKRSLRKSIAPAPVGEKLRGILLNKQEALSYLHKRHARGLTRQKRLAIGDQGIVCECCYNPCTVRELSQYCLQ